MKDGDEEALEQFKSSRGKADTLSKGNVDINLIDSILESAIKKLKLFLALPLLLKKQAEPLKTLLNENEFEQYIAVFENEDLEEKEAVGEQDEDDLIFYTYDESNLEVLFNGYAANPNLEQSQKAREFYSYLNKLYCKPKVRQVCKQVADSVSPEGEFSLIVLNQLRKMMKKRMLQGPLEEHRREKELSDMVQYNDWAKDEIAVLSRKFALTMNKQAQKIGEKCKEANQIQNRTETVVTHSKEMADFLGRTAENKMIWETKKSEYVQESLEFDAKNLETEFDITFSKNITKEKTIRVKRYKTEAQLITILKKYDSDIKDRDKSYKELLEIFEEEQHQLSLIKEQFEVQAINYHALMDEKEEYEQHIWHEKLYAIQMNMAARRIQRYYRAYVALCISAGFSRMKKKPKGKKKK